METTTKEIIKNLRESAEKTLEPLTLQMMNVGASRYDIDRAIQNYITVKIREFYQKANDPQLFKDILNITPRQESKAELSVAMILDENGIKYQYQYTIGNYRVDFLLGDCLVLEIDGPYHAQQSDYDKRRDEYMERMGYEVLRIPIRLFAIDPDSVVKQLKEEIDLTNVR